MIGILIPQINATPTKDASAQSLSVESGSTPSFTVAGDVFNFVSVSWRTANVSVSATTTPATLVGYFEFSRFSCCIPDLEFIAQADTHLEIPMVHASTAVPHYSCLSKRQPNLHNPQENNCGAAIK
jgi:hypothetical protein